MATLGTQIDTGGAEFAANADAMRELIDDLRARLDEVKLGGGDDARIKHLKRDKMLPRDRIATLIDHDMPTGVS